MQNLGSKCIEDCLFFKKMELELGKICAKFCSKHSKITPLDIYRNNRMPLTKSVAFNLVFRAKNRTLKDEEIEESVKNIKLALVEVGAKFRE